MQLKPIRSAVMLTAVLAATNVAVAEDYTSSASTAPATPAATLEYSNLIGAGNIITISRLPTVDANGKLRYRDMTISLSVTDAGIPRVASFSSKLSVPLIRGFVGGRYKAADNDACLYDVSNIGTAPAGRTHWSIVRVDGQSSQFCSGGNGVLNADWFTGPIASHPYETLLTTAAVPDGAYSYGRVGTEARAEFNTNDIIGAVLSGNQLTLVDFLPSKPSDGEASQRGMIVMTACVPNDCVVPAQ